MKHHEILNPTYYIYPASRNLAISGKNTNPNPQPLVRPKTLVLQSITKIQFKDREQLPVEKNYTDLDKVLSQLFRPLVKNYLLLFLVVFSSFKVIPSFQKIDYQL